MKIKKGDWVVTHRREKGVVVGFHTTTFKPTKVGYPTRPPPARIRSWVVNHEIREITPKIEWAWVLLTGGSSPYLFDLRCLEKIEVNNEKV